MLSLSLSLGSAAHRRGARPVNVIVLGNSKTQGATDPDNNWVNQIVGNFPAAWTWRNSAVNGERTYQITANLATRLTPYLSATYRNIVVIWELRNDIHSAGNSIATAINNMRLLVTAIRAQLNPGDVILNANMISDLDADFGVNAENAAMATEFALGTGSIGDVLIDLHAIPEMGPVGSYPDLRYFDEFGVHLRPAGQALLAHAFSGPIATAAGVVYTPAATVALAPASIEVDEGDTDALVATVRDAGNNVLAGRWVAWHSEDTAIATVTQAGVVSGVAGGDTSIFAYSGTARTDADATVNAVGPAIALETRAAAGAGGVQTFVSAVGPNAVRGSGTGSDSADPPQIAGPPAEVGPFDSGDYVDWGNILNTVFASGGGFTVMHAFRCETGGVPSLITKRGGSGYMFVVLLVGGAPIFAVAYGGNPSNRDEWDDGSALTDGNIYVITCTFDPTQARANRGKIYIEGTLRTAPHTSFGADGTVGSTTAPLRVGLDGDGGAGTDTGWFGTRVYDGVLTGADVATEAAEFRTALGI